MRTILRISSCLVLLCGPAAAQETVAPAAPAAKPADAAEPGAVTEDQQAAPAATPIAAPDSAQAPAAPAAAPAPTIDEQAARREWARREQQRAEIQLMLARARHASQRREQAQEREPEPPQRHGDAGAALAIGLTFDMPWYTDPGYDAFAEDDVGERYGLFVGYDVAALSPEAIVALELGWGSEHDEDDVLGGARTELTSQRPYLGATLRWVPIDFLQPHLRLAGGVAIVDGELRSDGQTFHEGGSGLFDDLLSPFGSAGLGFTLRTPTRLFESREGQRASLSFGLLVEGGYTLAKPLDIALDGPGPSARDIPLAESELGELKRSGPYIRLSLVGRI